MNEEISLITCKLAILPIVNTLDKIVISRCVYDKYAYNYYDNCHVESYNLGFFNVKHVIYELEHPELITRWTSNMDEDAYKY